MYNICTEIVIALDKMYTHMYKGMYVYIYNYMCI